MRKNYFLRAAAVLLVGCLFGLCTIPGTLSKYSYAADINSNTVRAGLFKVCVWRGGQWVDIAEGTLATPFSIDLFDTLLEDTLTANENLSSDSVVHVASATGNNPVIIAPGTGGRFKIIVKNFSEVDVRIAIASGGAPIITPSSSDAPAIEWLVGSDPSDDDDWSDTFSGIVSNTPGYELSNFPGVSVSPLNGEEEYEFTWRWKFHRGADPTANNTWFWEKDPEDTALGHVGTVTYKIPLTVTAEQID